MNEFGAVYTAVERFPAVTICAMVGNTVGAGAELAAACDLRIAGDNLKLRWVGGLLGVPVGPARLAPLVGLAAARHLVLRSPVVTAEEAVRLNLAFEVVPAADAHDAAVEAGTQLASRPRANVRRIKAMFREFEETERRTLKRTSCSWTSNDTTPDCPRAAPASEPAGDHRDRDRGRAPRDDVRGGGRRHWRPWRPHGRSGLREPRDRAPQR